MTLPAADGPSWPLSSTTRVDATLSPRRITVAKRMTIGKEENSIGLEVLIDTMMIRSDKMMLNVNITSSMGAGIGRTSNIKRSKTTAGVAIAPQTARGEICRKFDKN